MVCSFKNLRAMLTEHMTNAYINGYEDGTFRPSGTITVRKLLQCWQNSAIVLTRISSTALQLSDVPAWAWYYKYIAFLNSVGFITGDVYGTYRPDDNMSRAEFAILACRYLGLQPGGESGFSDCKGHMADGHCPLLEIMKLRRR